MKEKNILSNEWKIEALKRFPEISEEECSDWDNPYSCWNSLIFLFEDAYQEPRNEDSIKRICEYSEWCLEQPQGETAEDDLPTIVCVCFLEHIPTIPAAMEDMPRWIPYKNVQVSAEIFSYMVGNEGYQKILAVYKKWKEEGRPIRRYEDYLK
jgi:hypothetical protein